MARRFTNKTDAELREHFNYIQGPARARIERDIARRRKSLKRTAVIAGVATVGGVLYGLLKRRSR